MYFSWPCGGPVPVLIIIGSLLSTRWQVERDKDFTTCALIEAIEVLRDFFAREPARRLLPSNHNTNRRSNLQASWINVSPILSIFYSLPRLDLTARHVGPPFPFNLRIVIFYSWRHHRGTRNFASMVSKL